MKKVIARAPGRVNIIGEHTDYTGGYVFPMAIELGVTATVAKREDDKLIFSSGQMPDVVQINLDQLSPANVKGWAAYPAGSIWSISKNHPLSHGLDVSIDADLPLGAGMSSSAAVECSVILAATKLLGIDESRRELARWAKRAENEFVGVPTGSMDQVASMMAQANHALFFDTRDDKIEPIPIDLAANLARFVVIDTRSKHALIDGGYASRRQDCETASSMLGVSYLRDISDLNVALAELTKQHAAEQVMKRVRHVVSENARVLAAVVALRENNLLELGNLMNLSHQSLRDDFEVSCPELDLAVTAAMQAGALGARMMGGGFGGSAIALIHNDKLDNLSNLLQTKFADARFKEPNIYSVTASEGAKIVSVE